jgi:DNA-binding MarR family transcriptional regulator
MATVEQPAATMTCQALSGDLCWLLSQASHILTTEMTASLEAIGFSPRGHQVLCGASTGDHTQIELARMIGMDKTTLVFALDELEAAGLAERRPSITDRRARVIAVTKAGQRKLREANAILEKAREDVLSTLAPGERKVLVDALGTLVRERLADPATTAHPVRRRRA